MYTPDPRKLLLFLGDLVLLFVVQVLFNNSMAYYAWPLLVAYLVNPVYQWTL